MTTRLEKLIESGDVIHDEDGDYLGIIKSDNDKEVILGHTGEEDTIDKYLSFHPTPETW